MARTTINIDTAILAELKDRAHREHRSLGDVVTELLARALAELPEVAEPRPFEWITYDMGKPLIDLGDWKAVRDYIDDELYLKGDQ